MFINFCQIKDLLPDESLTLDSYNEVENIINNYSTLAIKLDQYGETDKANTNWEDANKLIYLVLYLTIIRQRIFKDFQNCTLQTLQQYKDIYKLDCIKKEFSCLSIPFNVDNLYNIFGVGITPGFDGIDFMAIETDSTIVCDRNTIITIG